MNFKLGCKYSLIFGVKSKINCELLKHWYNKLKILFNDKYFIPTLEILTYICVRIVNNYVITTFISFYYLKSLTTYAMKNFFTFLVLSIILSFGFTQNTYAQSTITIGTGTITNSSTSYPSAYGQYFTGDKNQYLILASELQSAGASAGLIRSLAFDIVTATTATSSGANLTGFNIKIGSTTATSLTSWQTGLTSVFSTSSYTSTTGWNTHNFTTSFMWDGTSNIVIETCFDNYVSGGDYSNNAVCNQTSTSFASTINYHSDGGGVCASSSTPNSYSQRPNMKLGILTSSPQQNDLALLDWVAPLTGTTPSATMPISIDVFNVGLATQDSFPLKYSIDGGTTWVSEVYNDTLAPSDTLHYTFTTTANMGTQGSYNCIALVRNQGDTITYNDTVYSNLYLCTALSGIYTIGPDASDDFSSFSDAVFALNNCGVSGPTVFNVDSGTYNEQVEIGAISGASATNTITFKSANNNQNSVTLTSSNSGAVLFLNGAEYVTVKHISIIGTGAATMAVKMDAGANHNTMEGNIITLLTTASATYRTVYNYGATTEFNTIKNNVISGGYYGIYSYGSGSTSWQKGTVIEGNNISNFQYYGIMSYYQDSIQIIGNYIHDGTNNSGYGIYAYYDFNGFNISKNKIVMNNSYSSYGIFVYYANYYYYAGTSATGLVSNNFISIIAGTGSCYGIYAYYSDNVKYYYNSVNITGGSTSSRALYQGNNTYNSTGQTFKNNIFKNTSGGYAAYFSAPAAVAATDYNNYYATGTNLAYWSGNKTSLAALQTASNKDMHSVSIDPEFTSNTDLHFNSISMDNLGTFVSEVTTDIDGYTRSTQTPDIGADENIVYAHNLKVRDMSSTFQGDCNMPSNIPLYVEVVNLGTSTETSFPVKVQIDGGTIYTQNFSGQLAYLDTAIVTFPSISVTPSYGNHSILVYTDLVSDSVRTNDTIGGDFDLFISITNFPFYEDFESGINKYFHFEHYNECSAHIDSNAGYNSATAIHMEGGSSYNGWNYTGSDLYQNIANNYSHHAKALTCDLDLSNYSNFMLSFDLDVKNSGGYIYNNWFYVTVNDSIIISSISGDSIWHNTNNGNGFESVSFNLSQFAGDTITLQFNGIMRHDRNYYDGADIVSIDNIRLWEPISNDLGAIGLSSTQSECGSSQDSIYVIVKNFGLQSQSNYSVTLSGNLGNTSINQTVTSTTAIAPNQKAYIYIGMFNTSENVNYNLNAYSTLATDGAHGNDTFSEAGYMERYKTIPHVETFDNQNPNWNLYDFYIYPSGNSQHSNVLVIESYGGYGPINGGSFGSNGYAIYQKNIGRITPKSYLTFDYSFVQNYGFYDSVNIYLQRNCGQSTMVYSFNPSNYQTNSAWYNVKIPIGAYTGEVVQLYLERIDNQSDFLLLLDNFSIVNSFDFSLGNDTTLCNGETVTLNTGLNAANGYTFSWTGPGATSNDSLSTFVASSTGLYICEAEDNNGFISYDSIYVQILPPVLGHLSTQDSVICNGDSSQVFVNLYGAFPLALNWTDGSSSYVDTATSSTISRYFSPNSTTQYSLTTITDSLGCTVNSSSNLTITVNQLAQLTVTGLDTTYCTNNAASTLTTLPTGGILSGNGITSGNLFNPAIAGAGTHQVFYTYTDTNNCVNIDTLSTTVLTAPIASIVSTIDTQYCANEPPITLFAYPSGGVFSGSGVSGSSFIPAMANIGSDTIFYNYTASNGCSNSDTVYTNIDAVTPVTINTVLNSSYCADEMPISLTSTPSGGTFTINGDTVTTLDPSNNYNGLVEVIYSYSNSSGCASYDTISTMVYALPQVQITTAAMAGYCQNAAPVNLSAYPAGGTFAGSGINGSTFYPDSTTVGSQTITYSFTDGNSCSNIDTIQTLVYQVPTVNISTVLDSTYCNDEPAVSLTATPSGGVFTGMGMTGNSFDPATAGNGLKTIIYTFTSLDGCINSDTVSTIVNPKPNAFFATQLNTGYCQDAASINLVAYPSGGTFSGNGVNGSIFYPDSATVGAHSIYYNYTDINGCSDSDTIQTVINALPTVTLGSFADICANVNQLSLTGGSPSGGSYSGNSVNSGSGYFYPSTAGAGLQTIVYNYVDGNGCSNSDTNQIRVVGVPLATFTLPGNVCIGDSTNLSYTGNASSAATYNWSFANATILSGTNVGPYTLKWDTAGIKALSLIVTDSGCTSQTFNNYTNVLDAIALATSIGGSTACYGDSVLLFANSGLGYSYEWFDTSGITLGDTLSFYNATQSGVYYVEVTNNYGCSAVSNNVGVQIFPQINSDFSIPSVACKDDLVSINYLGTADTNATYNWNFDGGVIASGSASGPYSVIWNTDSLKNISLVVDNFGCSSINTSKTIDIITTPASITVLGSTTFCDGGSVTLYPNSGANYSYKWFKDGVSLNDSNAYYTATQSGNYTVEVTNNNIGCVNTSDSTVITVNTTDFNLAFTANQTNFTIPPFNVNISNQTIDTTNYYWGWSMGDGATYTVANPSHQYAYDGTYTVGVVAQNINTGCYDTLIKNNYITCQGGNANPCTLVASITPGGPMSICPGDSVLLTAANNPGATYQWLKDGILIPGEDTTIYWARQTGNYQVMVSDTICSQYSTPFSLSMHTTITPIIASNGSIMPCTNDSMELYVTSSFNSYLWSNGKTTSSIYVRNSSNYSVVATDANGCKTTSQPFIINASLLTTPEICIVGVDSATNTNFVVWERQANPLIDSFRVYRESSVAGVYNLIGATGFNDPGYFLDPNSNPLQQAYRYQITAIDTCGMETPPSNYHKTIHLSINAGLNGSWNLIWSHYVGFNFGSYRIYRGYDSTAMQPLTQIQSTLNSFTDLNPPPGKVFYQIEVVSPHPCYPDSVYSKAKTNYNTSRSNNVNTTMASPYDGFVQSKDNNLSMLIMPNPNKGLFTLEINNNGRSSSDYNLEVFDAMGNRIYSEDLNGQLNIRKTMHLETLSKGLYIIRLKSDDNILTSRIVIQ